MTPALQTAMEAAWTHWHRNMPVDMPSHPNLSFQRGFEEAAGCLLPLLQAAYPHVESQAQAEHLLDGFKKQERPTDRLVHQIREVLA